MEGHWTIRLLFSDLNSDTDSLGSGARHPNRGTGRVKDQLSGPVHFKYSTPLIQCEMREMGKKFQYTT